MGLVVGINRDRGVLVGVGSTCCHPHHRSWARGPVGDGVVVNVVVAAAGSAGMPGDMRLVVGVDRNICLNTIVAAAGCYPHHRS